MPDLVAGHEFDSLGRCVTCPRRWTQIMHVTRDQIGEKGIAHYDGTQGLTLAEYQSIERHRNAERPRVWEAVVCSATGSGPAAPAADDLAAAEAA